MPTSALEGEKWREKKRPLHSTLPSSSAIINMLFFLEAEDDASLAAAGALTGRIMCASLTRMTISGFSLHLPHKWERRPTAGSQPDSSFSSFLRSFEVVSFIAALVSSFTQSSPVRKRQPARARHPRAFEAPPEWQSANGAYDED